MIGSIEAAETSKLPVGMTYKGRNTGSSHNLLVGPHLLGPSLSSSLSSGVKHGPRNIGKQRELRQASRWWLSTSSGRKSRKAQGLGRGGPWDLIKHPSKCLALGFSHPERVSCYFSFFSLLLGWLSSLVSVRLFARARERTQRSPNPLPSPPLWVSLVKSHSLPCPEVGTVAHLCC